MKYWLFEKGVYNASVEIGKDAVILTNGLVTRKIDYAKGTVVFDNLVKGIAMLNAVVDDCHIIINNAEVDIYKDATFVEAVEVSMFKDVDYVKVDHATEVMPCPAIGKCVELKYNYKDKYIVSIYYEIFDDIPVIAKRIFIKNLTDEVVMVNKFRVERLNIAKDIYKYHYAETSYIGGGQYGRTTSVVYHEDDELLDLGFDMGPDADIASTEVFEGLRAYTMLTSADTYEQKMIEVKQMYRYITPWVLDSPLIFHVTSDKEHKVIDAIHQARDAGFDAVIQSFKIPQWIKRWVDVEDISQKNIAKHKKLYDYSHSQGIKIGGYTLAIIKNYLPIKGPERTTFLKDGVVTRYKRGIVRCLATEWAIEYWTRIFEFYDKTGADMIEIDGPYHFNTCAGGPTHLHNGFNNGRYQQWNWTTVKVFAAFKKRGVYINTPDNFHLTGGNKTGIGYEEVAYSQPRREQLISARLYYYQGTFNKLPSMGWGFLPIGQYLGGGSKATFAPLGKNIVDYEWAVFQAIMSGVIPCFRGKKLYDDDKSLAMMLKWTKFYKEHKRVLNGNTIHFMPAVIDSNNKAKTIDIDCALTCVGSGEERGILAVYNQTDRHIRKTIKVPVYYTGLTSRESLPRVLAGTDVKEVKTPIYWKCPPHYANGDEWFMTADAYVGVDNVMTDKIKFSKEGGEDISVDVDDNADAYLEVDMAPMSYTYYIIRE